MKGKVSATPAQATPRVDATAVATHPYVAHQQHLSQTNNVPLPGGYQAADPQQIGQAGPAAPASGKKG